MLIGKRRTIYLIDSENVNDAWVRLLPRLMRKDKIVIFFTKNSPHFAAEHAKLLAEYKKYDIIWEKCFTGNNALDFQLVSRLGYFICKRPKAVYVILSNDTGYDPVVKYWQQAGISICRVRKEEIGQEALPEKSSLGQKGLPEAESPQPPAAFHAMENPKEAAEEGDFQVPVECVLGLCRSISIRRLNKIHEALVALLGPEQGRQVYFFLRDNKEFHEKLNKIYLKDRNTRMDNYIEVVLSYHGLEQIPVERIRKILLRHGMSSRDQLYKSMTGTFGQKHGADYYGLLKHHLGVLKKI